MASRGGSLVAWVMGSTFSILPPWLSATKISPVGPVVTPVVAPNPVATREIE
jgi:hypothetical protein